MSKLGNTGRRGVRADEHLYDMVGGEGSAPVDPEVADVGPEILIAYGKISPACSGNRAGLASGEWGVAVYGGLLKIVLRTRRWREEYRYIWLWRDMKS